MKNRIEYSSRIIKWIVILLVVFFAVSFTVMIVKGTKVYPGTYTQDPYPPYEGSLDRHTAQFLSQQDYFVSDLSEILKSDSAGQGSSEESDGISLSDRVESMKQRLTYMEKIDVADAFSDYKQEVDSYFSDIISALDSMMEEELPEADQLPSLYAGLADFVNLKTDDLPALFDELGVKYTIEEDGNGGKTIHYSYTDVFPMQ